MKHQRTHPFRRKAVEHYQRPFELDMPDLLRPWHLWPVVVATVLILLAWVIWP